MITTLRDVPVTSANSCTRGDLIRMKALQDCPTGHLVCCSAI